MAERLPINPEEYAHEKGDFTDVHTEEFEKDLDEPRLEAEEQESLKVAAEKLELLKNTREIALRFLTEDEYQRLVTNKELPGREVLIFEQLRVPAIEFIKGQSKVMSGEAEQGWQHFAKEYTMWPVSIMNMNAYEILLRCLQDARTDENEANPNIHESHRKNIIERFRDKLVEFRGSGGEYNHEKEDFNRSVLERKIYESSSWGFSHESHDSLAILDFIKEYPEIKSRLDEELALALDYLESIGANEIKKRLENEVEEVLNSSENRPRLRDELDRERRQTGHSELNNDTYKQAVDKVLSVTSLASRIGRFGKDRVELVMSFINSEDPESFDLRKLFAAIAYVPRGGEADYSGSKRQYHIALLLETMAKTGPSDGIEVWTTLSSRKYSEINKPIGNAFLGAIALMPDKELERRMAEVSKKAGDAAHPIFNRDGVVRYPKTESQESENQPI